MVMPDRIYTEYRPVLFRLAYKMLGSAADAEDLVHDVFARYMQMEDGQVRNEKAYLIRMTANRCLNELRASRRRREVYTGPWLPEPLPERLAPGDAADPAERRENIGYAYLVLLQQLTPLERLVYLLKETLGFEYRDIAGILEKSEQSCRKTFSRARQKAEQAPAAPPPAGYRAEAQERFAEAFLRAADTGNFKPLLSFLMEEVALISDGGGKTRAALKPILGVDRVRAFFEGLAAKGSFREGFRVARVNGETGLLLAREGRTAAALCAEWEPNGSRIRRLFMIVNPDKLLLFNSGSPETCPSRLRAGSSR